MRSLTPCVTHLVPVCVWCSCDMLVCSLQDEFKEAHKDAERQRASKVDPTAFQRELDQLESEREQLRSKLGKLQVRARVCEGV